MRLSTILAAIGLTLASAITSAATPEDFAAAIDSAQTGVDLYKISNSGVALVAGSPFAPTILPHGIPAGTNVIPIMTQMSTQHHYLYVVYEEVGSGVPNILVQYAVHATGLVENWAVLTDFNGSNDLNHVAYLQGLSATANEILVYNHYPWGPTAEIFNSTGTVLAQAASDPSGQAILETIQVDPSAHFYYACFLKNSQASVSIFALTGNKLLQTTTDPTFIASECE